MTRSCMHLAFAAIGASGLLQRIDLQGDRFIVGADPGTSDFRGSSCGRVIILSIVIE